MHAQSQRLVRASWLALTCMAHPAGAQVSLTAIPPFMPAWNGYALDISADGSTVVGWMAPVGGQAIGFRWTASGGLESLAAAAGISNSQARAISADGAVIVGIGGAGPQPFVVRNGADTILPGPVPGGSYSYSTGVSGDGSVVVGYGSFSGQSRGWIWTAADGYVALAPPPGSTQCWVTTHGISSDGRVIAGYSGNDLLRWTGGVLEVAPVTGKTSGVMRSGHAVLFATDFGAGRWWDDGRVEMLGTFPGSWVTWPWASSDDGAIIGGDEIYAPSTGHAWVWTQATGAVFLSDYLSGLGLDTTGWDLRSVKSISADGRVLAGFGRHEYAPGLFRDEAFVVNLPAGGSGAALLTAIGVLGPMRKRGNQPDRRDRFSPTLGTNGRTRHPLAKKNAGLQLETGTPPVRESDP